MAKESGARGVGGHREGRHHSREKPAHCRAALAALTVFFIVMPAVSPLITATAAALSRYQPGKVPA